MDEDYEAYDDYDEIYSDEDLSEEALKFYDETDMTKPISRGNGEIRHGLSYDEARNEMIELAKRMTGTNFAVCVEKEDGTYSTYSRVNQPCQGGEMRKYFETHGNLCTRPDDKRPGDLRDPFPSGKPVMISRHFHIHMDFHDETLEAILSPASMYRSCTPKFEFVKDKKIKGVLFEGLAVDPTGFVNLQQYINSVGRRSIKTMTTHGLTEQEALLVMMLDTDGPNLVSGTSDYYFPVSASIRRIMDADFHDLSGGTFEDGFDYNRPDVQNLFKAEGDELVTNWYKVMHEFDIFIEKENTAYGYTHRWKELKSPEAYCETAKEIIRRDYQAEISRLMEKAA